MKNIFNEFDIFVRDGEEDQSECKGLIFRGKCNYFINSKGVYVYQERMVPMKRMSCKGCSKCLPILDDLNEFISMGTPPIISRIEHDALYELKITNMSRDWESGYIDDWDLEFVRINNP